MLLRLDAVAPDDVASLVAQFETMNKAGDGDGILTRVELERFAQQQQSQVMHNAQTAALVSSIARTVATSPDSRPGSRAGTPAAARPGNAGFYAKGSPLAAGHRVANAPTPAESKPTLAPCAASSDVVHTSTGDTSIWLNGVSGDSAADLEAASASSPIITVVPRPIAAGTQSGSTCRLHAHATRKAARTVPNSSCGSHDNGCLDKEYL